MVLLTTREGLQKLALFSSDTNFPVQDRAVLFQWLHAQRHTQKLFNVLSGHLHLLSTRLCDAVPPASPSEWNGDLLAQHLEVDDENAVHEAAACHAVVDGISSEATQKHLSLIHI